MQMLLIWNVEQLLKVAYLCDIPFMAIRSVSDTPNGNNAEDFDNNLAKASSQYVQKF